MDETCTSKLVFLMDETCILTRGTRCLELEQFKLVFILVLTETDLVVRLDASTRCECEFPVFPL